jgi:cytosine/adenosine deaminase-related metal-dependent hydrolase
MAEEVAASSLFCGADRGLLQNVVLRHDDGVIASITEETARACSPRSFLVPAFINAHDHARPAVSSFGSVGMSLESWLMRSALAAPVDPF